MTATEHTPEHSPAPISAEEEELLKQWMEDHPEPESSQKELVESGPFVAEFEKLVASFESTFSLAELHAITELAPEDAPHHPVREPAKEALIPILDKLRALQNETSIAPERFEELKAAYARLSRAVGVIRSGKVDHDRKVDRI